MKFDIVIGNPPYQEEVGDTGSRVVPLYQKFIEKSLDISNRYVIMITPTRWYNSESNIHMKKLNELMLKSGMLTDLVDYDYTLRVFDNVDINGGVSYFKIDKQADTKIINFDCKITNEKYKKDISKYDIIIRDRIAEQIIDKVVAKTTFVKANEFAGFINEKIQGRCAFGIDSTQTGTNVKGDNDLVLISKSNSKSFINRDAVSKNKELVPKYKVYASYLTSDVNTKQSTKDFKVIPVIDIAKPDEVTTETYIILRTTDDIKEAENFASYIKTRFVRFIVSNTMGSIHLTRNMYMFVPEQDFSKSWTDEELYDKYGLNEQEINYIEYKIKEWRMAT